MPKKDLELEEKIRRLVIKIVKHYRGKGPENVKIKLENSSIEISIKGILSNLSEILVKEGAVQIVKDYWKIMKPYLEKEFSKEVYELIGSDFKYSWEICNLENEERTIIIKIDEIMV